MRKLAGLLTVALLWFPPAASALNGTPERPASDRGTIYGGGMMTPPEQDAYRRKMWELKTETERERFRREHHERMQERARDLGVHLPDDRVYLDRPYFEKGAGEREGERKSPPGEALRRLPREADEGEVPLRRWKEEPEERWGEKKEENVGAQKKGEPAKVRRWPPERRPVIRPEAGQKIPPPRVPPGSGTSGR